KSETPPRPPPTRPPPKPPGSALRSRARRRRCRRCRCRRRRGRRRDDDKRVLAGVDEPVLLTCHPLDLGIVLQPPRLLRELAALLVEQLEGLLLLLGLLPLREQR